MDDKKFFITSKNLEEIVELGELENRTIIQSGEIEIGGVKKFCIQYIPNNNITKEQLEYLHEQFLKIISETLNMKPIILH